MKNKKNLSFFLIFFLFFLLQNVSSEEFYFETPEILTFNNGNLIKALNGGRVLTDSNVEIIADEFEYDKITTLLEARKNAIIIDDENEVTIKADKIFYLKNKEKIYTIGETEIVVKNEYFIVSKDVTFLRNKMLMSSDHNTTLKDYNNYNFYTVDNFNYLLNDELFRGTNINTFTPDEDEYFFSDGIIDLKTTEMMGKDLEVLFHKDMFNNNDNQPRLRGNTGYTNDFESVVSKGVFTTCKIRSDDKCPPWMIEAKEMKHDKVKKIIWYKNAWLKVYDIPVLYYPRFFHPDPTVKRQSGLLRPQIGDSEILGSSAYIPYFYVISDESDLTIKPRMYADGKYTLQNELRHVTQNTENILDFSLTRGHDSYKGDIKDSRTHFFSHSTIKPEFFEDKSIFKNFENSALEIQLQRVSNDTYLNLFSLSSPLFGEQKSRNIGTLNSYINFGAQVNDNRSFSLALGSYEKLSQANSDRYEIFPSYGFNQSFDPGKILKGNLSFNSSGSSLYYKTNVVESKMINDLRYESQEMFLNSGIRNTYYAGFKNVNTGGKNSTTYKDDFNSQGLSEYIFRTSYPLIRNGLNFDNYLTPKISLQYSPHNMINLSGNSRRIDAKGVWSVNRIGQSDSVESGQSLTIGMDFKRSRKIQGMLVKDTIKEVESDEPLDVLELNLAGVFRDEINEDMPITSSLNQTSSDLLGKVLINPAKYLKFEYDFNLDNNFDVFKYNGISTTLDVNNFLTTFKYAEENDPIGKAHYWENITEYQFNDTSSIQFATRRNKKINLTEFYDLIYQYKNDCLTAAVKYRRDYYDDRDIKPTQDLFFSLTIVPLGAYQTKNLFNNNEKNN